MSQSAVHLNPLPPSLGDPAETYCANFIGRGTKNTGTAFLMPDDNASGGRGGHGSSMGNASLSDKYDLGRHMLGDRTTSQGRNMAGGRADATPEDVGANEPAGSASQGRSSLRALVGRTCATSPGGSGGEKAAGPAAQASAFAAGTSRSEGASTLHLYAYKGLEANELSRGTANASQDVGMMRLAKNSLQAIALCQRGELPAQTDALRGGIFMQESSAPNGQDRQHQKREQSKDESFGLIERVAVKNGADGAFASDKLETPRMEQISQTLMEQIERIRQNGTASNVRLSIDLPDGSSMDLQLRWRGKQITARFGSGTGDMRAEIENGWARLTLRAGNAGMRLEAPTFEEGDEPCSASANHYA